MARCTPNIATSKVEGLIEEKLGKDYTETQGPGGPYVLYLKKTKPSPENAVTVTSFVVMDIHNEKLVYEYRNLRGQVEWVTGNVLLIRETKGILFPDGTNHVAYCVDVSTGKRVATDAINK